MTVSNPLLCTPPRFVEIVREFFGGQIDLDPCPNLASTVCAARECYRPECNGLVTPWTGRVYVNPPWGYDYLTEAKTLVPWLAKCAGEANHGAEIIAMIPTAPGSECWRDHVLPFVKAVCFVDTEGATPIFMAQPDGTAGEEVAVSFLYYGMKIERFAHGTNPLHSPFAGFASIGSVWRPA